MMTLNFALISHRIHECPCLLKGFEVKGSLDAFALVAEVPGMVACEQALQLSENESGVLVFGQLNTVFQWKADGGALK